MSGVVSGGFAVQVWLGPQESHPPPRRGLMMSPLAGAARAGKGQQVQPLPVSRAAGGLSQRVYGFA